MMKKDKIQRVVLDILNRQRCGLMMKKDKIQPSITLNGFRNVVV